MYHIILCVILNGHPISTSMHLISELIQSWKISYYIYHIYIWDNPSQLTNSMIFQRCSYTTKQCNWWFPPMIWNNENNALEILLYI